MSKRKYAHMMQMEPIILQMKEAGMVHSEIAVELGLTTEQVKSCVWRYLKRKKAMSYGKPPNPKGRPRKDGQPPKQDAYFKLTQSYGITPSMSSKGNPYDNAMAENFFSILKTECIYRHKPKTLREANDMIDRYIHFYNHERIQIKTGVAPLTLRHSA